ncbi:YitT family protein [Pallidibacillus pasinlerensis]|nr:YitT family protein [Pallidibacillus pasinlerensis]
MEALLIPNRIIDGGVVGISLILEEITPIGFSKLLIIGINIPFQ